MKVTELPDGSVVFTPERSDVPVVTVELHLGEDQGRLFVVVKSKSGGVQEFRNHSHLNMREIALNCVDHHADREP